MLLEFEFGYHEVYLEHFYPSRELEEPWSGQYMCTTDSKHGNPPTALASVTVTPKDVRATTGTAISVGIIGGRSLNMNQILFKKFNQNVNKQTMGKGD